MGFYPEGPFRKGPIFFGRPISFKFTFFRSPGFPLWGKGGITPEGLRGFGVFSHLVGDNCERWSNPLFEGLARLLSTKRGAGELFERDFNSPQICFGERNVLQVFSLYLQIFFTPGLCFTNKMWGCLQKGGGFLRIGAGGFYLLVGGGAKIIVWWGRF